MIRGKRSKGVLRAAEGQLGRSLTKAQESFLEKYGYLPGAGEQAEEGDSEHVAAVVRNITKAFGGSGTFEGVVPAVDGRRHRRLKSYELRRRVLSELLAGIAERDQGESLAWFREKWLPAGLLQDPAAVQGWLDALWRESKTRCRLAMEDLHGLAVRFVGLYGWTIRQAMTFTMTGLVPSVSDFAVRVEPGAFSCNTKLSVTIDPALTPREVARRYTIWRSRLLPRRARSLGEKHMELARFASRLDTVSGADMSRWNGLYGRRWTGCGGRWAYQSVKNFARDIRVAKDRLIWPAYRRLSPSEWQSAGKPARVK